MSYKRKQYTVEFKQEAVRLAEELGNVAQAARELGIHESMLHRWKQQLAEHGDEAFPGPGNLRSDAETVRQLRRENKILRQEREILKKTEHLCATAQQRYAFIAMYQHQYPVVRLCRLLAVSPNGYYAWRMRQPRSGGSRRQIENERLIEQNR